MTTPVGARRRRVALATAAAAGALFGSAAMASGQVTLDGSVGPATPLSGPAYTVGPELGQLRGPNLFHSFGQLNLARGESLTFTGPSSVRNVAARVTGGSPSSVAGTLRVDIAGANLLLINPAGVVFRDGAFLDVTGSFAVTTADFVRLADGGRFDASRPGESVLTSAPPSAFGFLSPNPGSIQVQNTGLGVQPGRVLSVVGGDVRLQGGTLFAAGGRANVVAARGPADVALDVESLSADVALAGAAPRADVALVVRSQVNVDSSTGNRVTLRAGKLSVEGGSSVSAQTFGAADGGGIDIGLTGDLTVTNGTLDTSSFGGGRGGDIDIRAHSVTVDGRAVPLTTAIRAEPGGGGAKGGSIRLTTTAGDPTGFVRVSDAGQISTTSFGASDGGDIRIESPTVVLDGTGAARVAGAVTGVVARTVARPGGGRGGAVEVVAADRLEIVGGAVVSADTFGSGAGGDVSVTAGDLLIDGRVRDLGRFPPGQRPPFTGIASGSFGGEFLEEEPAPGTFGPAGKLTVDVANDIVMLDGASLASASFFADAQDLAVNAGRDVVLRGRSRITGQAGGDGGNVTLRAGGRFRSSLSTLSAETFGGAAGDGGNLTFEPTTAVLNESRLIARAAFGNGGDFTSGAENFLVSADTVRDNRGGEGGQSGQDLIAALELTGGLVALPDALLDDAARLQALCGLRVSGETSSFIVTGRGGAPPAPGGWTPAIQPVRRRR